MRRLAGCGLWAVLIVSMVGPLAGTVSGEPIGRGLLTSSKRVSSDSSGTSSYLETHTYDLQGNRLKSVTEYDAYDDGIIDSVTTVTNTYDARGHLLTSTTDWGMTTYTYDVQGRLTEELSQSDFDGDGVFESGSRFTKTYDASGNVVQGVTVNMNWDGSMSRWIFTITFGPNGNELVRVDRSDSDGDGVFEDRGETTRTYDARGNALTSEFVYDHFLFDEWDYVSTMTMAYDAQGNLLSTSMFQDYAGQPDYAQVDSAAYDTHSRVVMRTTEYDYGGDGVIDSRAVLRMTYDAAGRELTSTSEEDFGADGTIEWLYQSVKTYDAAGNMTSDVTDVDDLGSPWASHMVLTRTYDATGNMTSQLEETYDENGVLQYRTATTNTY